MAGTNSNFPAADFRKAIRATAKMAAPNDALMRPTFHWDPVRTVPIPDVAGRPYRFDGSVTPDVSAIADLTLETVVATVEKIVETAVGTGVGPMRGSKMTLTVLDVDYDTILERGRGRFADAVLTGDTEYRIDEIPMPVAIFNVDVWTIFAYASTVAAPR